jgi:ABC-type uncharacterized transport system substrate-binding protein
LRYFGAAQSVSRFCAKADIERPTEPAGSVEVDPEGDMVSYQQAIKAYTQESIEPWISPLRAQRNSSPGDAAEVAGLNVDVIVAGNSPAGLATKNASKTIPIVIATMGVIETIEDPVQQRFATSLAHPRGSITGLNLQTRACRAQACLSYQNCL